MKVRSLSTYQILTSSNVAVKMIMIPAITGGGDIRDDDLESGLGPLRQQIHYNAIVQNIWPKSDSVSFNSPENSTGKLSVYSENP